MYTAVPMQHFMSEADNAIHATLCAEVAEVALPLLETLAEAGQQAPFAALQRSAEALSAPAHLRLAARALFELLEDLAALGWQISYTTATNDLRVIPLRNDFSTEQERREVKAQLRRRGILARDQQLGEPTVARRIRTWEAAGVRRLFLSGRRFAEELDAFASLAETEQINQLAGLVDPYIEVADDRRDAATGLRLRDIWTYARYTWSMPFHEVPGRRIYFLVRDAARPAHPVVGIGALGSCVAQLTPRDRYIGWSSPCLSSGRAVRAAARQRGWKGAEQALRARLFEEQYGSFDEAVTAWRRALADEAASAYTDDLVEEGILEPHEIERPTALMLSRLAEASSEAPATDRAYLPLEQEARLPLFRQKRLQKLLLIARAQIALANSSLNAEAALSSEETRSGLRTALRFMKQRHAASRVMDITTCGALPPYNAVLGGKLISLLMASPHVLSLVEARYRGQASNIASAMAGRSVVRPSSVVLLTTTSLYQVGSSQYERIRVPTVAGELHYRYVGDTLGHGSIHVSMRTHRTFAELLEAHPDLERPGNRFGEGVNARMRLNHAALSYLGLSSLQRHDMPRRIYVVPLLKNTQRYLAGLDDVPLSVYGADENASAQTQALIDYWRQRWLHARVLRPETRALVRAQAPVNVGEVLGEHPQRRETIPDLFDAR